MKDFYYKLGLEPTASESEIEQALAKLGDDGDHHAILLHPERKSAYDDVHATLSAIATLRHRLRLDEDESWFIEHCGEFAIRNRRTRAAEKSARTEMKSPEPEVQFAEPDESFKAVQESSVRSPALIALGVVAVVAILILLAFALF